MSSASFQFLEIILYFIELYSIYTNSFNLHWRKGYGAMKRSFADI